jgi:hypothetical protein
MYTFHDGDRGFVQRMRKRIQDKFRSAPQTKKIRKEDKC